MNRTESSSDCFIIPNYLEKVGYLLQPVSILTRGLVEFAEGYLVFYFTLFSFFRC